MFRAHPDQPATPTGLISNLNSAIGVLHAPLSSPVATWKQLLLQKVSTHVAKSEWSY